MLNKRQMLFCKYYCGECEGNASAAAIKAGYSAKNAAFNTSKLLNRSDIKEYINKLNSEITKNYAKEIAENTKYEVASIAEIHAFWTSIFRNEDEETKDRLKASELLAKCKGMFNTDAW